MMLPASFATATPAGIEVETTITTSAFATWQFEDQEENVDIFVEPIFSDRTNYQLQLSYQRYDEAAQRIEFGKRFLEDDEFAIDKRLKSASVSAQLDICFAEHFDTESGDCTEIDETVLIDIQWQATGDLERDRFSDRDISDDGILVKATTTQFREAEATGSVGDEELGESSELNPANLQSEKTMCIATGERSCEEEIGEED